MMCKIRRQIGNRSTMMMMMSSLKLLLIFGAALAAFCNIQRSYPQRRRCNPDHVHRNKFTVHGLWPQLNGAKSPVFCKTRRLLQHADLIPLRNKLLEYWPNLFSAQNFQPDHDYFWKNEWKKHGTCSSIEFPTPGQYLNLALDLAENYARPIFDKLHRQGIIPDGTTLLNKEPLSPVGRCSRVFIFTRPYTTA
ncbi:hypothetical protein K1719_019660 [Acacia pycnantha]|nr:hypothetical protein K1719_019660 [Acacia pycnantha]